MYFLLFTDSDKEEEEEQESESENETENESEDETQDDSQTQSDEEPAFGLKSLLEDLSDENKSINQAAEQQSEMDSVAALAESIQPKGNTLLTTSVSLITDNNKLFSLIINWETFLSKEFDL